jgi:UDP-N-acetylmuramoylalanine--D-glutamate ligase
MNLTGQHIAILGTGRSGVAAARLALHAGACVSAWDQAGPEAFAALPPNVACHPHASNDSIPPVCDMLVVSPGIDTYGPLVRHFSQSAKSVIGEVELASRFFYGKCVGITGTNGKTTTTAILAKLLAHAGLGGTPCGNFGTPLAEVVLEPTPPDAISLELSSFQLETIQSLRPDVAIWLNFAPDHMDRYPTVGAYRDAKLRILENLGPNQTLVVRSGEDLPPTAAKTVVFSTTDPESEWFSDGRLLFHHGARWIDLEQQTSLRGLHNAENAMAAIAAAQALGIPDVTIREGLAGFTPPAHRCEWIRTIDGVDYLNDSKATNLHALESALRSQTRPVVLIAGGKDKGLDYAPVLPLLREKSLATVTFGQIARPLAELFSQAVPSEAVATLADAVSAARSLAPAGSIVLLSPGTSSFDQFSGYEQRGNAFRDLVHQLP